MQYSVCVENDAVDLEDELPTAWVILETPELEDATTCLLTLSEALCLEPELGEAEDEFAVYQSDDGSIRAYIQEYDEII